MHTSPISTSFESPVVAEVNRLGAEVKAVLKTAPTVQDVFFR